MAQVSAKLRSLKSGALEGFIFWCPGCKESHQVFTVNSGATWTYNNNPDFPTFKPSILIMSGHHIEGHIGGCWCDYNKERPEEESPFKCYICHSFVTDGKIQFLADCSHELAGVTIDLPDLPEHMQH